MSKRCSAKNCFNSVLYNSSIAYFSFPKNQQFAEQWAELAGRSDLVGKPLTRIVKYYLCSEHFTANCFVDKETRQILKRNLPHSIAIPTIFKNNLQETMQNANPRQPIEVHNIILLDVDDKTRNNAFSLDNQIATNDSGSEHLSPSYLLSVDPSTDGYFVGDSLEEQCGDEAAKCEESSSPLLEIETLRNCRLCLNELSYEHLVPIERSPNVKAFIERVMSKRISLGDCMSQVVCENCQRNATLCLLIIQQMDAAQQKIPTFHGKS